MEEKSKTRFESFTSIVIRFLALAVLIFGCLSIFASFFYFPFTKFMGLAISSYVSVFGCLIGIAISQASLNHITKQEKISWFELISSYTVYLFSFAFSITCAIRLINWTFSHFLKLDVRLFDVPPQ